ncbi:gentisate 1,2-dioxygenase [Novosphingobium sp. KN65.2]|uniref:gentisate 1,2-dioxygenase n=1 Tax=Novosphingobium sp. KN65.2 TaxID=1478134 RepID=UPI0005E707E7|nr:gentisate 1,2-dioxygenase [Novosphingobium sp. KN65.2]CDO36605.1 Putative gentisate 1,2-dioxygenase with a Cupin, RmlC-type domain [Novosphingobium sp. KN65.2]
MTGFRTNDQQGQLRRLYEDMRPQHLYPLWEVLSGLVTPEPVTRAVPAQWRYADVRHHLMRAGDLISAEQAERRVIILENPGLAGESAITPRLYAGLQLVLPGEVAPCHRHSQSALRFVMEGAGAFTAIDGEKAVMSRYDLILTPNWRWHDHGNPSPDPMIWLDGLDIPTVRALDAQFAEKLASAQYAETLPPGTTRRLYGRSLRPLRSPGTGDAVPREPMFHYPYAEWRDALDAMARIEKPDPHVGHALEFRNPATGGSVMPTISAQVRLLPAGFETCARQSTESAVFVVVSGTGEAEIGGETFVLSERDVLVVPTWKPTRWRADGDLVLFGFSDRVVQEKLCLYRECLG